MTQTTYTLGFFLEPGRPRDLDASLAWLKVRLVPVFGAWPLLRRSAPLAGAGAGVEAASEALSAEEGLGRGSETDEVGEASFLSFPSFPLGELEFAFSFPANWLSSFGDSLRTITMVLDPDRLERLAGVDGMV